jgi:hypothetical protein
LTADSIPQHAQHIHNLFKSEAISVTESELEKFLERVRELFIYAVDFKLPCDDPPPETIDSDDSKKEAN